jgi:hypothetical protein
MVFGYLPGFSSESRTKKNVLAARAIMRMPQDAFIRYPHAAIGTGYWFLN